MNTQRSLPTDVIIFADEMEVTKQILEMKNEDWQGILAAVTKLFQLRKYPSPELTIDLPLINDKLTNISQSEIGQFFGEFYQDHILTKCMIILRQDVIEERGHSLLAKLSELWTQFYTSILPTLLAMFAPIQLKSLSVRALTLIAFRDTVLLKTEIHEALDHTPIPSTTPEFRQMCLVLQSVHKTPPSEQFFTLVGIVKKVVQPYLSMVTRPRGPARAPSEPLNDDPTLRTLRAETSVESPEVRKKATGHRRVHSLGHVVDQPTTEDN